jgi:hypothetical protein
MAVPVSVKQMALTRDIGPGGFMDRLIVMMPVVAGTVLGEAENIPYHPQRIEFARRVIQIPSGVATQVGPIVVMGETIVNTTVYNEGTKQSTCTATDEQLEAQISAYWNLMAGVGGPA